MHDLEDAGAVALLVLGYGAVLFALPWCTVLLHEFAHAAAVVLCGGRVLVGHVGSGVRVLPLRAFGARWELRPRPTHGAVKFALRPGTRFRAAAIFVSLAGPLMSTAIAGALVVFAVQGPDPAAA